jgi:hypothetical protein
VGQKMWGKHLLRGPERGDTNCELTGKVERGRGNLFSMDKQYIKKIIKVLYIALLQKWSNRNRL